MNQVPSVTEMLNWIFANGNRIAGIWEEGRRARIRLRTRFWHQDIYGVDTFDAVYKAMRMGASSAAGTES